ncbi:uncharacterized protein LOC144383328 isoform X2 [Gasterosteus aculeatus]
MSAKTPIIPSAASAPSSQFLLDNLLCRMDENYNILPHGVNFQDAIFADTSDNRPTFSSLFQFSNSTQGSHSFHVFSFLVGHTGGQQANATEPDFKLKDWVFLNYTQGCSGG